MSQINTLKAKALLILATILFTTTSFANVCDNFLGDIKASETLVLSGKDVSLVHNSELSPYQRMLLDKEYIDEITALLVKPKEKDEAGKKVEPLSKLTAPIFTQTETESVSVISKLSVDVFIRYEDYVAREIALGNSEVKELTVQNHLAHAILIFNNHDNPRRANEALNYVKANISPLDQFKSTFVLINLVDFFYASGRLEEAKRTYALYLNVFNRLGHN